jgi:hypothetical protein
MVGRASAMEKDYFVLCLEPKSRAILDSIIGDSRAIPGYKLMTQRYFSN